jgi:nitrogen fixation NifU-like protein
MDDMYREYILDHYQHPHNFGELDNASFEAEGVNPLCGDQIRVQVKVDDADVIEELRFTGNGCAISQASMSILSDKLTGMKLADVEELTRDDVIDLLGIQLSPMRVKCAVLGLVVTKTGMHEHAGTSKPAGWDGMDELAWRS